MLSRPNPRGAVLIHLDSGAGLANATVQQRIVAVRLFYEFLVEDGLREQNPVRRGQTGTAHLSDPDPLARSPLRAAAHAYNTALDRITQQAGLTA